MNIDEVFFSNKEISSFEKANPVGLLGLQIITKSNFEEFMLSINLLTSILKLSSSLEKNLVISQFIFSSSLSYSE